MNYLFIIGICIILLIIITLLTHFKKIKSSEAYVIERKGKFNRIVTSTHTFLIPFLDRVKCIVNLNSQIKKCYINPVILSDGNVINTNNTIYFHISDTYKAVYEIENLEKQLEYLQVTLSREIIQNLDSSKIKNINEDIMLELKSRLNKEVNNYGCQIDNVDIKIWNDDTAHAFEFSNQSSNKETNHTKISPLIDYEKYKQIMDINALKLAGLLIASSIILAIYILSTKHKLSSLLCEIIVKNVLIFLGCIGFIAVITRFFSKSNYSKVSIRKVLVISLILTGIYNILELPTGAGTNLLNFEVAIFKDIIVDETTSSKVKSFITFESHMSSAGRGSHNYRPAYISYRIEGNSEFYSSKSTNSIVEIIDTLQHLEDGIEIEYYNYSKIIKSIDGIETSDVDKLQERIDYLKKLKEEKIKEDKLNQEQEQEEKERLEVKENPESKLRTQKYTIAQNSIGKNIQNVKKELEAIGTSDISIKYINSKYYPIGTVAFVERDGENFTLQTFYVVKSNDSEDLTQMPQLKRGMSKDELIQIFEQSELNYKFTVQKSDSSVKGLHLYTPPGIGTYFPKDSIVNVTIFE